MKNTNNFYYTKTLNRLNSKESKIALLGLGYVGLPLALEFSKNGYQVLGIDIDQDKINSLNKCKSYISYIPDKDINIAKKNCLFTSDFSKIQEADAIIICVPTPLSKYREPDLSYILISIDKMIPYLRKGQVISLESTTFPGTTEEIIKPILEKKDFKVGNDLFLIYSPERYDPGNKTYNTKNTPKILGGCTELCNKLGLSLYKNIINELIPVSSTQAAEMAKLIENIQRAVNIGLVNELKILTDKMNLDIDIYEVIKAASTKPFGFAPYFPGPGLGGHCIPVDPFYLTWKVKQFNLQTKFIDLAGEINSYMPQFVLEKTSEVLNNQGKSIKNSKILLLGLTYKKNIEDIRESPALTIFELLISKGALVGFSDPFLPNYKNKKSISLTKENLLNFDLTILLTDHDIFNYGEIKNYSNLIIDTRGRYKTSKKIYRA